jgi:hypothetical protein
MTYHTAGIDSSKNVTGATSIEVVTNGINKTQTSSNNNNKGVRIGTSDAYGEHNLQQHYACLCIHIC